MDNLFEHPAVVLHGSGTSAPVLADFCEQLAEFAGDRVVSLGATQYDDEELSGVERKSLEDLKVDALEEIADAMFYLSAMAAKILAIKDGGDLE